MVTLPELPESTRQYVAVIDERTRIRRKVFLRRARLVTARLYADAMALPDVEPGDRLIETSQALRAALFDDLKQFLGPLDLFGEIFDPYDDPAVPIKGSLADGMAEIYVSAQACTTAYDAGERASAIWFLKFGVEDLWGHQAIDAVRALHAHLHLSST